MSVKNDSENVVGMGMKNEANSETEMKNSNLLSELEEETELSEEQMNRVMEQLREDLKDIEIPESIKPENMMHVLENRMVQEKKKVRGRMIKRIFCGMAACLVLGIGLYSYEQSYQKGALKTVSHESIQEKDNSTQKKGMESTENKIKKESETVSQQSTTVSQVSTESTETSKKKENIQETITVDDKNEQEKETVKKQDNLPEQKDVHIASDYNEIYDILTEAYRNAYGSVYYDRNDGFEKYVEKDAYEAAPNENNSNTEGNSGSNNIINDNSSYVVKNGNTVTPDAAPSDASGETTTMEKEEDDYSKTNTVEENVDEADIVKTDGKYIYTLYTGRNHLEITKVEKNKLSHIYDTTIEPEKKKWELEVMEMYVQSDRLIIISNMYKYSDSFNASELNNNILKDAVSTDVIWSPRTNRIRIDVYDISDKKKIERISSKSQDGSYHTSRISEGILYVFTDFLSEIHYSEKIKQEDITANEECLPKVAGKKIAPGNTYILDDKDASSEFYVISAWNVEEPNKCLAKKTILGQVNQIYVSQNAIYLMKDDWRAKNANRTKLLKFIYENKTIEFKASVGVKGSVDNSFAVNESNGYLRVVAHVTEYKEDYNTYTNLYILNENMKVTGSVKKLAEGEDLHGVRYVNNIAYFVTFEQVDPLFSVDVSDPSNPKVLGKLKIPGFSEYLHLWSDNLLLGIGEEDEYVKLSMFDISDPSNVKEVAKKVIRKGDYTDSTALNNYKSVCIMPEKNIIGFTLYIEDEDKETEQYVLFSYSKKKGFQKKLTYTNYKINLLDGFEDEEQELLYQENGIRGIYIRNQFFVVVPGKEIARYDMKDCSELEKYSLQKSK